MAAHLQRFCLNHAEREAVARCPECGQFFCRECIVEHEERVVCAVCLKKLAAQAPPERRQFRGPLRLAAWAVGVLLAWLFFYATAQALLLLPDKFHSELW